jgi:hypothetical protein
VRYPRHDTYLWGAAADDGRPPSWLVAAETSGLDKRPLDAVQILDSLLSLPDQFGPAVFVMFSFGYDITQILKHLPYEKAWQIEKWETYSDRKDQRRRIAHSPVLWKGYAISYVKGKSLDVWRLADPEKPYRGKKLHTSAHIRIYDVFGFFQSSFSAVVRSCVASSKLTWQSPGNCQAFSTLLTVLEKSWATVDVTPSFGRCAVLVGRRLLSDSSLAR